MIRTLIVRLLSPGCKWPAVLASPGQAAQRQAGPTRRAILARLASGEASVTELARPFDMTLPAVSKHLKVLERAGLIARTREAQWRPCRLEATPLREVFDWVEHYRRFWEASFDRLDEYLRELQSKEHEREQAD